MACLEGAESQEVKQKGSERHNGACDVEIIRTCKMRSTLQRMQMCRRCNKIGHFASIGRSTQGKVHSLDENYSSDDEGLDQDMHLRDYYV